MGNPSSLTTAPDRILPAYSPHENVLQGHIYCTEEIKKQINMGEEEMENQLPLGSGY